MRSGGVTRAQQKYSVETKIWRGARYYQVRKRHLAMYLRLEGATEGFYAVFDHRQVPVPRVETETVDGRDNSLWAGGSTNQV